MRVRSTSRLVNGIISAFIVVFFLAHGTLGCLSAVAGFHSALARLVWVGMALVLTHVIVSVVTSYQQLTDTIDPPSMRKKRHLALKWATGILLTIAVCTHVVCVETLGWASSWVTKTGALVIALVAITLATHLCVGAKSLLKDIQAPRRYRMPFRAVACVFAVLFSLVAIIKTVGII